MILHFELQRIRRELQPDPRFARSGMPAHIVQRFLQNAIDVHACACLDWEGLPGLLIVQRKARLVLHSGNIPVQSALQPRLFEKNWMQGLGKRSNFVQCRLRDSLYFFQLLAGRRSFRQVISSAAQYGPDRGQDLAKLVVQFTGDMPQSRFLCRDQFLRQIAPLFGEFCKSRKNLLVAADEIKAGRSNRNQRCRQKNVELALHPIVNLSDACRGLFFAFVILHQEPRNSRAESLLARLKRQSDLLPRFGLFAALCQREHPLHRVPELRQRLCQVLPLLRCTVYHREALFEFEAGIQILMNAVELGRPGC